MEFNFFDDRVTDAICSRQDYIKASKYSKEKINEIIRQIKYRIGYFENVGIDRYIKQFVVDFVNKIELFDINCLCINNGKPSEQKNKLNFGRIPIMNILCDIFESVLSQNNENLYIEMILSRAQLWPLRDGLLSGDKSLSDILKSFHDEIESYDNVLSFDYVNPGHPSLFDIHAELGILNINANEFNEKRQKSLNDQIMALESVKLLYDVLSIINEQIYNQPKNFVHRKNIFWCEICFRRASNSLKYCRVHNSKNDTRQKQGQRVSKKFNEEAGRVFIRYRNMRMLLGDNPIFLENSGDIINNKFGFFSSKLTKEFDFYRRTVTINHWSESQKIWVDSIESQLSHVKSAISHTNYQSAPNWDEFVKCIFSGLDDRYETTTHPFWVKEILKMAELWLFYETYHSDKRTTRTKAQIIELIRQGKKPAEIEKIIKKSRAYIYRVKKENGI